MLDTLLSGRLGGALGAGHVDAVGSMGRDGVGGLGVMAPVYVTGGERMRVGSWVEDMGGIRRLCDGEGYVRAASLSPAWRFQVWQILSPGERSEDPVKKQGFFPKPCSQT